MTGIHIKIRYINLLGLSAFHAGDHSEAQRPLRRTQPLVLSGGTVMHFPPTNSRSRSISGHGAPPPSLAVWNQHSRHDPPRHRDTPLTKEMTVKHRCRVRSTAWNLYGSCAALHQKYCADDGIMTHISVRLGRKTKEWGSKRTGIISPRNGACVSFSRMTMNQSRAFP